MAVDAKLLREVLDRVTGPSGRSLVAEDRVTASEGAGGTVIVTIAIAPEEATAFEAARAAVEAAIRALPGVEKALVALTAERAPQAASPADARAIAGVARVVAVASGKGGVGKSTTAGNLALALARLGLRVGLLDADIYGPSVPRLMGASGQPKLLPERILEPPSAHGIKVMSIGLMVADETPLIWRGPMIDSALTQMLREVAWAPLDVLVIDMPPGTGDAQLTLARKARIDGAVIVSTPQDLALIDARRGVAMFRKTEVPVLGIVENMSSFVCPVCGYRCDIFGHGGARSEAARIGVPFLGEVPLHMDIRRHADSGRPTLVADPESPQARAYLDIASRIKAALEAPDGEPPPPPKRAFFGV